MKTYKLLTRHSYNFFVLRKKLTCIGIHINDKIKLKIHKTNKLNMPLIHAHK